MQLHNIKPTEGSRHRRKRVGRGDGSGMGGTATRGHKGQMSRSGANHRPFFEGGQMTLFRRLPKRGFKSISHKQFTVVNVSSLEKYFEAGEVVNIESLRAKRLVGKKMNFPIKLLAHGDLTKSLTVKVDSFSEAAKAKVEAVGGTCETIA